MPRCAASSQVKVLRFGPNTVLQRQGALPDGLFFLLDGSCMGQLEIGPRNPNQLTVLDGGAEERQGGLFAATDEPAVVAGASALVYK